MCRRQVDAGDRARGRNFIQQPIESLSATASRIEYMHSRAQTQTRDQPAKFGLGKCVELLQLARVVSRPRVSQ
jgi:hypothetical protein